MTIIELRRRGNTFRDDFNSHRPVWRAAIEAIGRFVAPVAGPIRRALRQRARGSPPLSDRLRRDVGLPPLGPLPRDPNGPGDRFSLR